MSTQIKLKPIQPKVISFWITGTSPMIQHAWNEKALAMLRMTASERKKQPKEKRNPEELATACMHKTPQGDPALPMLAFKASLIGAAHKDLGIEKTLVRKAVYLSHKHYVGDLLTPLVGSDPVIREDIVKVGMNQTDIRYRPMFEEWSANIVLQIDPDLINEQDIVNLVNRAGFSVGLGEWRPEKGGEYGRFQLDVSKGLTQLD